MASGEGLRRQLPSSMVANEFGEVNLRPLGDQVEVEFTILLGPQGQFAEGWQTAVALDASGTMRDWYGRLLLGKVPPEVMTEYERRGWIDRHTEDGREVKAFQAQAFEDAIRRGHLRWSENIVQPLAREFIAYLAQTIDADRGTTVVYWACGNGSVLELVGDFTAEQCRTLDVVGPRHATFGTGTCLTPAVKYFVERFRSAPRCMFVFITDGKLDDLPQVKAYTTQLAREVAARQRNYVKCVLIGVGDQIDEGQMVELDDLETGTDVDIWDHKIAREMRGLVEIFAEVVSENQIVAPSARLLDATGREVKTFPAGLPAKVSFLLPAASPWFELEVHDVRIRQPVVAPK